MKKIKDSFSYSVGHGAIGISCSHKCKYFSYSKEKKKRKCIKYNLSLDLIMVKDDGFIKGEYICNGYEDNGAHEIGLIEFYKIKNELEDNILYEACGKEYLCMTSFDVLPETTETQPKKG